MPYLVNRQLVPEALIREEFVRIARDRQWDAIADSAERARQIQAGAEQCAINRVLIDQTAANDPRPIEAAAIDQEVIRQMAQWNCRSTFDPGQFRPHAERNLRLDRIKAEMLASAVKPTVEEMHAFYNIARANFKRPLMFHASHIVKYVTHEQSEEQAEAGIDAAEAELERGVHFAEVADRHSDCRDKGGDLGWFPTGYMVEEFEEAIRDVEPGHRTGTFTTPFGFHIAFMHSKRPAGLAEFEDVRPGIEEVLTFERNHHAYLRAVAELRSKAEIIWVPDGSTPPNGHRGTGKS